MSLKERLNEDMKSAMKARETARLSAIRMLMAAIKQKEVDERIELDDAQVLAVIEKGLKQRRDSIAQYEGAGRQDLADAEKFEVDVLSAYMPRQLSEDEIVAAIREVIAQAGATGPADMGKVMGPLKARLSGQADMGKASALVKKLLSGESV